MSQRFEELVSRYLDEGASHDEEAELLGYLEQPEYEDRFLELTRLNEEISGLLAAPIADETMVELVNNEITRRSGRTTSVCQAIIDSISSEECKPANVIHLRPRQRAHIQSTLSTPAGALALSICFHAAMVVLILGLQFTSSQPSHSALTASRMKPEGDSRPIARLESVTGEVYTINEKGRVQAKSGGALRLGQDFETVGVNSTAQMQFADGTELILQPDTRVSRLSDGQDASDDSERGKAILLERGVLRANVAKQPKGQPMIVVTTNAEVTVLGTRFSLASSSGHTRLEVTEGLVRMRRLSDNFSVQVKAGEFAVVAPGVQMAARTLPSGPRPTFVKGINLTGGTVVIEGDQWISYKDALADGLKIKYVPTSFDATKTKTTPVPAVDVEMAKMLNTRIYSWQDDMEITQSIQDGRYEVYLWAFEPAQAYSRSFDILVQDKLVHSGAGRLQIGAWQKYGPYRAQVQDGMLKIHLRRVSGTAALSGISIFKRSSQK